MIPSTLLDRLGFNPARLNFTLRTAFAACCALLIAWLLRLEHPQWSAMTVWAASQPIRGHLLEKSFFRALGTIIGALFSIGLLIVTGGNLWAIVIGLSVWIGLCAAAGNIVQGIASYGAVLAGYSAAMVALLHSNFSDSPFAVGVDRVLTVLVGVAVALVIGWFFAAPGDSADPLKQVDDLIRRTLRELAAHMASPQTALPEEREQLLSEMAQTEDRLEAHAAGSLRSRASARYARRALLALTAILFWMQRPISPEKADTLSKAAREAAETDKESSASGAAMDRLAQEAECEPGLHAALQELRAALTSKTTLSGMPVAEETHPEIALHRDWYGAWRAAFRAVLMILTVGLFWLFTGWEGGPYMLLGTAIMTSVFSMMDEPARMLRQVIFGQTLGVIGALLCRWLVWPAMGSELALILAMIPFILFGGFLFAHRRASGPIGFDYNMVMLLLLQPALPLAGSFAHSLTVGMAVILGPISGLVAYMLIFPMDAKRRLRMLMAMMLHDVEAMASRPGVSSRRSVWRMRFYHRILRLMRWADKTGERKQPLIDGGYCLLLLGSVILHVDEVLQNPATDKTTAKQLATLRARLGRLSVTPEKAAHMLASSADRLADKPMIDVSLLREAAQVLSSEAIFMTAANMPMRR